MSTADYYSMFYPDSSDAEEALYEFTPAPPDFITSWCRNGHDLRIDPGAAVLYIETYSDCNQMIIIRNGHGHPKISRGVVLEIIHKDRCVKIKPQQQQQSSNSSILLAVVVSKVVHWDMVVGRDDESRHSSFPLALNGTKTNDDTHPNNSNNWMIHRTLDFKSLQNELPDMKNRFLQRVLDEQGLVSELPMGGTLAAIAFESLKKEISLQATRERVSFFAAAERRCYVPRRRKR